MHIISYRFNQRGSDSDEDQEDRESDNNEQQSESGSEMMSKGNPLSHTENPDNDPKISQSYEDMESVSTNKKPINPSKEHKYKEKSNLDKI